MPSILTLRRGTEAQNDAFTGSAGEITVDNTNQTIRVHDGVTAGGSQLATNADLQNTVNSLGALASQNTITESQISDFGTYLTPTGDGSGLTGIDTAPYDSGWITADSAYGHYSEPYGPIKYRRVGNIVNIQGITANNSGISDGNTIFTLPVGFRPDRRIILATNSNNQHARLDINNNGEVTADSVPSAGSWFSCAATFITADPVSTNWNS